jgi:tetratricopeptide (TPR) repeat protein
MALGNSRGGEPTESWEKPLLRPTDRILRRIRSNPEDELEVCQSLFVRALKQGGPDSAIAARATRALADKLAELNRYEEELHLRTEHLAACRRNVGPDHLGTASAELRLAICLSKLERYEDADLLLPHAISVRTSMLGEDDPNTIQAINLQSNVSTKLGRRKEARELQTRVLGWYDSQGLGESEPAISCVLTLATTLASLHEFDESTRLARRAYDARTRVLGSDDPSTLGALGILTMNLMLAGRNSEANVLARDLVERVQRVDDVGVELKVKAHELFAITEGKLHDS